MSLHTCKLNISYETEPISDINLRYNKGSSIRIKTMCLSKSIISWHIHINMRLSETVHCILCIYEHVLYFMCMHDMISLLCEFMLHFLISYILPITTGIGHSVISTTHTRVLSLWTAYSLCVMYKKLDVNRMRCYRLL